jgi:hypothetical protein
VITITSFAPAVAAPETDFDVAAARRFGLSCERTRGVKTEIAQSLSEIRNLCYEYLARQIKAAPPWQARKTRDMPAKTSLEHNPRREPKNTAEFFYLNRL